MANLFSESDRLDNLYFHKNINNALKKLAKRDIHNINNLVFYYIDYISYFTLICLPIS